MQIRSFMTIKEEGKSGWQMRIGRGKFTSLFFPYGPMHRILIPQRPESTLLNSLATVDNLHDFRSYLACLWLSSPSCLLAFRQHIADSKILIISVRVIDRSWTDDLRVVTYLRATRQALASAGIKPSPVKVGGFLVRLSAFCAVLTDRRKGPHCLVCFRIG